MLFFCWVISSRLTTACITPTPVQVTPHPPPTPPFYCLRKATLIEGDSHKINKLNEAADIIHLAHVTCGYWLFPWSCVPRDCHVDALTDQHLCCCGAEQHQNHIQPKESSQRVLQKYRKGLWNLLVKTNWMCFLITVYTLLYHALICVCVWVLLYSIRVLLAFGRNEKSFCPGRNLVSSSSVILLGPWNLPLKCCVIDCSRWSRLLPTYEKAL